MLIKNAKIVLSDDIFFGDLRIENGKISKIGKNLKAIPAEKITDAEEKYLLPSLIDTNVRLLDDTLNKKNIEKLLLKAKDGGISKFVLIDDFLPRIENATHLELLNSKMSNMRNNSEILLSVNSINKEKKLANIATFLENGAKVLYTRSDIEGNLLIRVMQYANMKNRAVFCYCEDASIKNNGVINDGNISFKLGLPGVSKIAEISEVSKIVELATFFDVYILFQGISTSKSIHILKAVKKDNKKVFTEVPIHNLLLNETECDDFNTNAKLISPLRDEAERKKMLAQLQNGDIDVITSAHSPKSYIYKDVAFEDAKDGIDALGLTLKLGYTYLVKHNILAFNDFMNMVSRNPAKILSLDNCGEIKEGNDASILLFDDKCKTVIDDESSLYNGKELFGKIEIVKCK